MDAKIEDQIKALRLQTKSDDAHVWDRYIRKFRRDHHIAVISGWNGGLWNIGSFGRVQDSNFQSEGIDTSVQYSFHLQIKGKFGYYLGSSTGYYAEYRQRHDNDFGPSSMWKLPGIVAGIAYNYNPTGRFLVGSEAYLSRIVRLETRESSGESESIAVTGETFDLTIGWDKFVSLTWGIRLQAYDRKMWVPKPKEAEGYLVDAKIGRTSRGVSLGTVYHFL